MVNTIIIQAGGMGSRMAHYTNNIPKCLLPYKGKTILENNLTYFKDKRIIIIVDHLSDVLISYVNNILKLDDIIFVKSKKKTTTSGIIDALEYLNNDESFALIWSDLFLSNDIDLSVNKNDIIIGTTSEFSCRWSFENSKLLKKDSITDGVMGIFIFNNKQILQQLDEDVSFVGGNLTKLNQYSFTKREYKNVIEIGNLNVYNELLEKSTHCRFFNSIEYNEDVVIKKCIDSNYKNLIDSEISWYVFLQDKVDFIPNLISTNPFTISRIHGKHLYNMDLSLNDKYNAMESIYHNINTLHNINEIISDQYDVDEIYFNKTFKRVESISSIIPNFEKEFIKINGKLNKNPFHINNIETLKNQIRNISVNKYNVIHGDITFSNLLFANKKCYFIDPRGYFGNTKIYGDKNYDWAKLYYSVSGNYDSINSKKFTVDFLMDDVILNIQSNGFENLSEDVISASKMSFYEMELLHTLIWMSLTGYVKEDIDAIYYSFYKGIELWNLTLN